jgi:hypothetical protein
MLRPAHTAAHAGWLAHQFGKQRFRIAAIRQEMPVTAVIADDDIIFSQVGKHTDRIGFLPQAGVGRAWEYPGFKLIHQQGFKPADSKHSPVQLCIMIHGCPPPATRNARGSTSRAQAQH